MSNEKLLDIMCLQACRMVEEINESLGEPFFYLSSCVGYFRLYCNVADQDRLVMAGRICIEGVANLILRLESLSICT